MKNRFLCIITAICILFIATSCVRANDISPDISDVISDTSSDVISDAVSQEISADESLSDTSAPQEESNMSSIKIIAGGKTFSATLCDSKAAQAFAALLPLTVDMSELNGNEKYFYLQSSLPTASVRPSDIHEGDLMLFGDNCLVLFYKSFSTSYSYTPLGCIDDPAGLSDALGNGSATVTFTQSNN